MSWGAGRLHHQKGFDRLLRAFAQTSVAGLELVILGEGAERGPPRVTRTAVGGCVESTPAGSSRRCGVMVPRGAVLRTEFALRRLGRMS